ncbi:MAG: heat-inducible transcriptional repressor HrcA [Armatimonadetes bacterium]|nr:heat-inducible transcriptional repressor HrcA [Armatimonadota bacterium]
MRGIPITPLDSRKQVILKAVVTDYVRTVEPVGSHTLMTRYHFGVKSATIRNELAELAELGYLHQPHTSAGRIPSDLGYRFYVDRLMEAVDLDSIEAAGARDRLIPHRTEVDIIIEQTCRILADLAHYTSMATSPMAKDAVVSHISVANVGRSKLLAVLVLSNGRVIHELLEFDSATVQPDPVRATNFLTRRLGGRTLESISAGAMEDLPPDAVDMKDMLGKVMQFIRREVESTDEGDVHLEGASYIMHQPEFKDIERLEAVLSVLEQRKALYKLFSTVYLGPGTTVIIGSENPLGEMRDCSFVAAPYRIYGRIAGTIGVIGPTRMDYPRAVGAVEFMARNLGDLLTALSVA